MRLGKAGRFRGEVEKLKYANVVLLSLPTREPFLSGYVALQEPRPATGTAASSKTTSFDSKT